MKCMEPVKIYWDKDSEKYSYRKPNNIDYEKSIVVSCGRCPACRKEWRTHLAQRVRYELLKYNFNERCFITLTADEDHLDEVFPNSSLDHAYFQKFIKRLRSHLEYYKIPHKPLKYLVSGEYGKHNTHRPHFHLILFGWKPDDLKPEMYKTKKGYQAYTSELLAEKWGAGKVQVGDVSEHTAPYMVKYICKHSEEKKYEKCKKLEIMDTFDFETGEVNGKTFIKVDGRKSIFKNPTPLRDKKGKLIVDENDNYICVDKVVKPPYIVYPREMLGVDYFLENYKQILKNGFILDSRGQRHSIPKNFLKYCKTHEENIELNECYLQYLERLQILFEEEKQYLISLGYITFNQRYEYYKEQGRIKRIEFESLKNKHR